MAIFTFVVDLRTLSSELLAQVKKGLLEFANLYHTSSSLRDHRIGLCYFQNSASSSKVELIVAYSPGTKFDLLDFHHVVNHLPSDLFSPFLVEQSSFPQDGNLSLILNDKMLSFAGNKEIKRKIIVIGACQDKKDNSKDILTDAAGRSVSLEIVFLKNIHLFEGNEKRLSELAKIWLGELKENRGLMAHFDFQESIYASVNRISCRLYNTINHLDEFILCKAHGYHEMHNSTSTKTLLMEESRQCWKNLCEVRSVIFNVIGKIDLDSLDKGLVIGKPYLVIPSNVLETDSSLIESDMNHKLFKKLYHVLGEKEEGLLCRSCCNLEVLKETAVVHHYILQPCDGVRMMLRRLAASEEILSCPECPDGNLNDNSDANVCLDSVALLDYKGGLGGFHKELNKMIQNRNRYRACCGSKGGGGGTIHVDEIYRSDLM